MLRILVSLLFLFSLCACGSDSGDDDSSPTTTDPVVSGGDFFDGPDSVYGSWSGTCSQPDGECSDFSGIEEDVSLSIGRDGSVSMSYDSGLIYYNGLYDPQTLTLNFTSSSDYYFGASGSGCGLGTGSTKISLGNAISFTLVLDRSCSLGPVTLPCQSSLSCRFR